MRERISNEDLKRLTDKLHQSGLITSCLTCRHFNEKEQLADVFKDLKRIPKEHCKLYDQRPPARVIAFGCPSWDDLPF